ncbi:exopolysaccharide biosynthesis polyprenyl glycosylphosphotransferase [Neobacillus notoginsengisoli]|uniref:Exopolysaccharide biosynthesis polyprenyl glycosylphosphotransferase n=1 Tax=Neobacillus notoginsengisoli TaxID=1578198 RepID=A0A417YYA3_9BACI|nr:exopolysaccharide biosynthesis polyprenyl glycosylphosphotransferase [Neobacillus notoginsengisoli]RHW42762.1 exopolysaccharide biosynthesis polyprenyl glycosylphosphotransferase [Neobacillus notoginsengisoli]
MKVLDGQGLIIADNKNSKPLYFAIKQTVDRFVSLCSLIILFPLLSVVAILIKLDSRGPIFYKQERLGLNGKSFLILKFRTMYNNAEKHGPQLAHQNDPRITRVGYFLRKYRIDEIPQFINILRGEMSMIGPRPERPVFIERFEKDIPHFRKRLQVRPGITGWAQTHGGYEIHPKEKLELDLYYIHHFSFLLDLKIIMKSIPVILFAKGWR